MSNTNTNEVNIVTSRKSPLTQPSPLWGEDIYINSPFIVHGSACPTLRIPKSAFRNPNGFTYIALLAAIVIIGITLGSAAKSWQNIAQRDKEEELLFRGNQYRLAIERYYNALPGRRQFPNSIDELLMDSRTPIGKRHLRQQYKDPITGEDFELVRDMFHGNTIKGVYSKSEKTPIKQADFPEELKDFEGKTKYSEWQFIKEPAVTTPAGRVRSTPTPT
jgi:type II secretory pathway pseudopilin PulG